MTIHLILILSDRKISITVNFCLFLPRISSCSSRTGYISRSVAGSYDYEGVAICAMIVTYTLWLRAVRQGSVMYGCLVALSYFYMVASWGGYVFVTNIIPLHAALLIVLGRYSARLHVAYTSFYVLATLLSMQVFFVGFRVIQTSDHLATHGVFAFMQAWALLKYVTSFLSESYRRRLFIATLGLAGIAVAGVLGAAVWLGYIAPFSGRFYSMFDPTYASKYIPIIASVSEHQPTVWTSYFFDTHVLILWFPVGIYHLFRHLDDERPLPHSLRPALVLLLGRDGAPDARSDTGAVHRRRRRRLVHARPLPRHAAQRHCHGRRRRDREPQRAHHVARGAREHEAPVRVVDSDAARAWSRYDNAIAEQRQAMVTSRYANPSWDMRVVTVGARSSACCCSMWCTARG
jgi:hypothetical protein